MLINHRDGEISPANAEGCQLNSRIGVFTLTELLGRGKSAYSYLAEGPEGQVVVKLMHHEPCPYYDFGDNNKVDLEVAAYQRLQQLGIAVPELLIHDREHGYLIKTFLDGPTVTELVIAQALDEACVAQVFAMANSLQSAGLNIDYFPDNFVWLQGRLFYVDYEHNPYDSHWDLRNWGLYYWANSEGMKRFKQNGQVDAINIAIDSGEPIKAPFEVQVAAWASKYE
ncbi:hypothetical protein [Aliagarivorans marinus]|uniref:hypothetical protein n=1 Tax=Aliagarivorans marinus TaxID=561965 RepID=UPI00040B557B|nr:hypothetical protein [Aliagarivorans marinus]